MKKNLFRRVISITSAAVLCTGACALFAGCSSNHPEVTITYVFDNQEYAVDYRLSRIDAPKTVTHFLELAEAGFYDNTCVHDYTGSYFYMGGYRFNGQDDENVSTDYFTLDPIDYFTEVKKIEAGEGEKKITFTQSVWKDSEATQPLYTVYGEFPANGNDTQYNRELSHKAGALVMYYTDKGDFNRNVTTLRNDGGKNNGGNKYDTKNYRYNSATSLFYTFTGESGADRMQNYAVFGEAIKYNDQFLPLVNAISKFISDRSGEGNDEYSFTTTQSIKNVNEFEQPGDADFESLRYGKIDAEYQTPMGDSAITIRSVKVKKY